MIDRFEKFLKRVRKKNGDKLLPVTIEKYIYFVEEYYKDFMKLSDNIKLIEEMNVILRQRPSIVIYSAFRMWLLFIGLDKKSVEIKTLRTPERRASAMSSKRFLQSKVLSRGELKRIFNEVDEETKFIFSALYDTACRRHELLNITLGDISFRDPTLESTKNIYAEINIMGKGAKSRIVYFGETTFNLFKTLRPDMNDKKKKIFQLIKSNGKPYSAQEQALYDLITARTQKILGRRMTPHCFRHTKLTHLADAGADVLGLSKYAGHENISTTMIYLEISNRLGKLTFENFSKDIVQQEKIKGEI